MRLLRVPGQLRELAQVSGRAARAHGCGRLAAARCARRARTIGFGYREALTFGLLDPAMPDAERMRHLSRHRRRAQQDRLNPVSLEGFTEEKLAFTRYCDALGVPVPALYGTVGRQGAWCHRSGRVMRDPEAFARWVDEELPEEFVVKPVAGYLGLGVRVLHRDEDMLVDADGRRLDGAALFSEVAGDEEFDVFVIQERLHNHPELSAVYHSEILQTCRLTTFIPPDGEPRLLMAEMKLGTGTGGVDNFRGGETGNLSATVVDPYTGELDQVLGVGPGGIGKRFSPTIPGTDVRIAGRRLPFSRECVDVVMRAAPAFLPMRTLGWDVAITTRGPVVVEANNWWGAPSLPLTPEAEALFFGP